MKSIVCFCILLSPSSWSNLAKRDELGILEYWTSLKKADVCAIPTEVCKMLWALQSMHAKHIFEYQPWEQCYSYTGVEWRISVSHCFTFCLLQKEGGEVLTAGEALSSSVEILMDIAAFG